AAKAEDKAAAPAATPPMPTPPPELDTLYKGFEGTWKCDTTMEPGAMGPGSPEMKLKTTVKIAKAKDLGNFWYRGEYEVKKTKTMPGFTGFFMLSYDAASKSAISVDFDSTGGSAYELAPGA